MKQTGVNCNQTHASPFSLSPVN